MALTETQKQWVVGGSIGAGALYIGYLLFRGRSHGGHFLPGDEHAQRHRKKRRQADGESNQENGRGEYGRKKHHHRERDDG